MMSMRKSTANTKNYARIKQTTDFTLYPKESFPAGREGADVHRTSAFNGSNFPVVKKTPQTVVLIFGGPEEIRCHCAVGTM